MDKDALIRILEEIILGIRPNILEHPVNMGDVIHIERILSGLEEPTLKYQIFIDALNRWGNNDKN